MVRAVGLPRRLGRSIKLAKDELRFRHVYDKYRNFTMIPETGYVGNLHLATRVEQIPGCIVECGTWRGGMIAGIADVLGASRRYYLFDSFEGLPPAQEVDGDAALAWQADTSDPAYYNNCTATEEEARSAMALSAAKDYQIIKGWFAETLPTFMLPESIALLRLDADWYESTKCILENFASRLASRGMVIVDDYYVWDGCARAVNEFAALRNWRIRQSRDRGICFILA